MSTNQEPETPITRGLRLRPRGVAVVAILAALVLLGGTAILTASNEAPLPPPAEDDAPVAAETPPPAGTNEFSNPEQFDGEDVRLSGTVTEVVNGYAFRMANDHGDELLVLHAANPPINKTNVLVYVHGQIALLEQENVEEAGGSFPLIVYQQTDEYALVASSVQNLGPASEKIAAADRGSNAAEPAAPPPTDDPAPTAPGASTTSSAPVTSAPAAPPSSSGGGSSESGSGGSSGGGSSGGSGGSSGGGGSEEPAAAVEVKYTGDQTSGQYSDEATFEATLTRDGRPVKDAKLTFELKADGSSVAKYSARTNRKGIAKTKEELTHSPRDYRVVVRYKTSDAADKDRETFTVERDDSDLDLAVEPSSDENEGEGNDGRTLVATLNDLDEGTALGSRSVNFYFEGELMGSATTDESGTARFEVPNQYKNQEGDFSAIFDGDDFYLSAGDGT